MQDLDVYSFGHLLHEISCGDSCNSPSITDVPAQVPDMISMVFIVTNHLIITQSSCLESVLMSILSAEAHKSGSMPSVQDLLSTPLFTLPENVLTTSPRLKLSASAKEAIKVAMEAANKRLVDSATELKLFRKQSKVRKESEIDNSTKRKAARSVSYICNEDSG